MQFLLLQVPTPSSLIFLKSLFTIGLSLHVTGNASRYLLIRKKICFFYCSDGPESVHILGPEEGRTGDTLTLECTTADSNPPVDVWWVVDGRAVQVPTFFLLTFSLLCCTLPGVRYHFLFRLPIVTSLRQVCSILYLLLSTIGYTVPSFFVTIYAI